MNLTLFGKFSSNPALDGGSFGAAPTFSWVTESGDITTFNNYVYVFDTTDETNPVLNESTRINCESTPAFGGYWSQDAIVCIVPRTRGSVLVDVGGFRSNSIVFTSQSPAVLDIAIGTIRGKRQIGRASCRERVL